MAFHRVGYVPKILTNGLVVTRALFVGGGAAADCTVTGGWADNVSSVAYNSSTGAYLITFREVGYQKPCINGITAYGASADFDVDVGVYTASAKTLAITVRDRSTGNAADLTTSDYLSISIDWCDSTAPQ